MQFEPETVNSYEVGWKGTFERGRFTTNVAAFWMDYSDVQVPSSIGVDTNNDGKLPKLPDDYKYPDGKPGQKIEPKTMFGHDVVSKDGQSSIQGFAERPEAAADALSSGHRLHAYRLPVGLVVPIVTGLHPDEPSAQH